MLGKVIGTACFKASGDNLYAFINAVRESNFACMSQRCRDGHFYGCIYMPDIKKLSSVADEYGVTLEFTQKKGMSFRLFRYRFRFGIIAGIVLLFSFVFYISNIVVSVEVNGNTDVTSEQIISALSDIGIYKGRLIADIDFHSCEQRLRLSIPKLAWTGIRHTGSRIVVDVSETTPPPEMIDEKVPCNIVADRDAQLLLIEVYSGKKVRSEGSGVRKGDIIISGVVDDGGGHFLKKHAMGKVIGCYEENISFVQPFSANGKIYADEDISKKYFEFFGHRMPLFIKPADCETFDYSETSNSFMLLGKRLPLGIVHTTYTPFEYTEQSYSVEEAEKLLQQKLALHEKNFYDLKGIEIKKRDISKKSGADKIEYEVKYELVGEIGTDYEIFVN